MDKCRYCTKQKQLLNQAQSKILRLKQELLNAGDTKEVAQGLVLANEIIKGIEREL